MMCTPMAISSVDAQTCCDQMTHSIALICCQHWNIPKPAIIAALQMIQKMKFCLQMNFSNSEACCSSGKEGLPFQGGCQGNGGAPALWIAISIILVKIPHQHGHIVEWSSAISGTVTLLIGFLFMDDTDLITMAPSAAADPNTVVEMMQENISIWCKSLNHTGGTLHPGKCSWHMLACDWRPDGQWAHHTSVTLPGNIQVPDPNGMPVVIE